MVAYAYYRLPYSDEYTEMIQTDGEPEEIHSYSELNGQNGFVMSPFAASHDQPILLIHPDKVEKHKVGEREKTVLMETPSKECSRERWHYATDFANFHARLLSGEFRKIVLARCAGEETEHAIPPEELFLRACEMYPRVFVSLVYTEKSGTWLMATPEILLDGKGNDWCTIALAGTMNLQGKQLELDNPPSGDKTPSTDVTWDTKNIQEQRYVATYVTECLERFTNDFHEEGPYTARAGNVAHLRSDFKFRLADCSRLGDVIGVLHPTPAVCGLPKKETYNFIINNEDAPRHYYSGFVGPLNACGETHLYVSLRCMQICGNRYNLYAGGGLLKDSVEQQEWDETEAKMETMRRCLAIKRM